MKKQIVFLSLVIGSWANAGAISGGGGKSVVCRDSRGKIVSAEVLDLYEARLLKKWPIISSSAPYMDQVLTALLNIEFGLETTPSNLIHTEAVRINLVKNILPDGTGLTPINDSYEVIAPKGCQIEQLANFVNGATVLIDGEIWGSLNETNKAALILHEAVYELLRIYGETTSVRARNIVGAALSGPSFEPIHQGVPQTSDTFSCFNKTASPYYFTKFYAFTDSYGDLTFQIISLRGKRMFTKTQTQIDHGSFVDIIQKPNTTMLYNLGLRSALEYAEPVSVRLDNQNGQTHFYMDYSSTGSEPTDEIFCFPGFMP